MTGWSWYINGSMFHASPQTTDVHDLRDFPIGLSRTRTQGDLLVL